MVNGRNKGAAWERTVAKMLFDELGVEFSRDLRQYQKSDLGDLICDDPTWPFVLELKRYASGYTYQQAWWDQVVKAADAARKEPVLADAHGDGAFPQCQGSGPRPPFPTGSW